MKFRHLYRPAFVLGFALTLAAISLAAGGAQAFTFENKDDATNGGVSNLTDPDPNDRLTSRFNSGKQTVIKRGNATIYFGGPQQTFDQRNNSNDYFSSDRLMGR